ncbi:cytochrome P450 [Colletotrichum godetiae]|uniref:Cytochrome P450 n=1 Tax=Colletotrichum godetiae TaxID=1209918 RepID=A0AAJ0EYU9_9PEZI|nr:cytochrome P450 [Colletotrichum godetiae]KAK1676524.1 cytochrome P450 [Colletotrichum godetiae]
MTDMTQSAGLLGSGLVSAPITVILLLIFWRAWIIVYRVFFHPLRKYPGPILYAASRLPQLSHFSLGSSHSMGVHLHKKYGPIVRIGPNQLSYIDPGAWKDIQGHRVGGRGGFPKDRALMGHQVHSDILHADDATHTRQRRIFSHAFSEKALREQESLIRGYTDLLVSKLGEKASQRDGQPKDNAKTVDIVRMYNFTTFDIMADLTFGEPLGMLQDGDYVPWVSNIFSSVKYMVMGTFLRVYPIFGRLFAPLLSSSLKAEMEKHTKYSNDRVDRRLQYDKDRGDIWSLVQRNADLNNISRGEMYANAQIFMIAGTETTATLLSGLTFLLCQNTDKLRNLSEEIRSLRLQDLNIINLQKLPYLNACLEEGLRMYPPAPGVVPRVAPQGGSTVCGQFVPEGTATSVAQYAAYTSIYNFADPHDFVPERWLAEPPEKYANDNKEVLQPFSYGPRNCIGKNLAYHEMRLILATVLWKFDIELEDQNSDWIEQKSFGIWEKPPLNVRLHSREV